MSTVGNILRDRRVSRGLKPSEVAAEIKLTPYLIEAMECGRFDRLPGGVYRRSFLRQYAHILGLDEEEIVATFKHEYEDPEVALPVPVIERHSRPWGLVWMVLAVIACAGAYRLRQGERPAPPERGGASTPVQRHGTTTVTAPPTLPPAVELPPATESVQPVRVAFTPSEPVWISVQSDGTESFRGTLEGPATREFGASRRMLILIGNSGGLMVSWNGRTIGPIGKHGEVQLLEVTAQGARVVPRKRPPATTPDGAGAN